jgi:hypothetical protein
MAARNNRLVFLILGGLSLLAAFVPVHRLALDQGWLLRLGAPVVVSTAPSRVAFAQHQPAAVTRFDPTSED